jgi:predicted RNA-binding protein with PUA-like domain
MYWLVKSEPGTFSFDRLVKEKVACWDGVRSYAARNHLRDMKKGDPVLFYHSGDSKSVVGIASVVKEYYQDPTTNEEAWVAVDLKAVRPLNTAVPLAAIKNEKKLKNIGLIRIPRLSVMPLTADEFELLSQMGK